LLVHDFQAYAIPEAKLEGFKNALWAIPLEATDDNIVDTAFNNASRIANRCFNTVKLLAPTAPSDTERREGCRASSMNSAAPAAKRARGEGAHGPATDENIDPDRGVDLKRRHEGFMTATAEKSLYEKCSTEGQIFSPMLVLMRPISPYEEVPYTHYCAHTNAWVCDGSRLHER